MSQGEKQREESLESPAEATADSELNDTAEVASAPAAVSSFNGDFRRLDPLAIKLWRIENCLGTGLPFLGAVVGGSLLWRFTGVPGWIVLLAWVVMASNLIVSAAWLPSRKYASWSYRVDHQVLELRFGIFWQTSVMIPLSRLQHIDLNRGPLERHFQLASLKVHTAGTKQASHEIPYLEIETGLRLRQRLIDAADLYDE